MIATVYLYYIYSIKNQVFVSKITYLFKAYKMCSIFVNNSVCVIGITKLHFWKIIIFMKKQDVLD